MCKIPPEAIATVIKFYHNLTVFLHYDEVPGLRDYVIADPQQLISLFAKILAVKGFNDSPSDDLWKHLHKKGILLEPLYNKVWANFHCKLKPQFLVDLLVHFFLATPIDNVEEVVNTEGRKYFVSCVLPSLDSVETQSTKKGSVVKKTASVTKKKLPFTCFLILTMFLLDFSHDLSLHLLVMIVSDYHLKECITIVSLSSMALHIVRLMKLHSQNAVAA